MENDEKRKKVIDELERRKKIIENYLDSNSSPEDHTYGYACYKVWSSLIDNALDFVKEDLAKYNACDYSNYESYCKSISKCCEKRPLLMLHRIAIGDFNNAIAYIGIVIDDINYNHYPVDRSELFKEVGW